MMKKFIERNSRILLIGTIFLAAVIRLYQLGHVPISPNWDEVAFGYNAFSILGTGRDEYGKFLPVVLESYNDYKPALYVYLVAPFVSLFGLNVLAVRLPAALLGILAVLVAYFFAKELFKRKDIALLSALLLAITPMHIQFSRTAFESNIGAMVNVLIALFFIKSLKRPWLLAVSASLSALNIYLYQSEKVFTPLLLLTLVLLYRKEFFALPKRVIAASMSIGLVLILPMAWYMLTTPESLSRVKGTSSFSNTQELLETSTQRLHEDKQNNNVMGYIFENRRVVYAKSVISSYLMHFDPDWMFIKGDFKGQRHPPKMGNMFLATIPFLLIGIYSLIFGKYDRRVKKLLFVWLLFVPIPASITYDVPNTIRVLNFLPILQIIEAIGLITAFLWLYKKFQNRLIRVGAVSIIIGAYFFNFAYYLNQYFVQYNYFSSQDWQYGYQQAVAKVQELEQNYDKVIVYNQEPLEQSYMFFLFYLKFPPKEYHKYLEHNPSGQFDATHKFGKYEFIPINPADAARNPNYLYVGRPDDFDDSDNVIKTIHHLNGNPAIKIAAGEKEGTELDEQFD